MSSTQITQFVVWPGDPPLAGQADPSTLVVRWVGRDLWLITHLGYVLLHDGQWQPIPVRWTDEDAQAAAWRHTSVIGKATEVASSPEVQKRTAERWVLLAEIAKENGL